LKSLGFAAALCALTMLSENRPRLRKRELVEERLLHAVEDSVARADLAGVGRVADDPTFTA
jgi:hypothetical protein